MHPLTVGKIRKESFVVEERLYTMDDAARDTQTQTLDACDGVIRVTNAGFQSLQLNIGFAGPPRRLLRHIPVEFLAIVVEYCRNNDSEIFKNVGPWTLFGLIEVAHYLQIAGLMDLTCQILARKINKKSVADITEQFIECRAGPRFAMDPKHGAGLFFPGERIARGYESETLINQWNFVEVYRSPSVNNLLDFIERRGKAFDDTVDNFLKFGNDTVDKFSKLGDDAVDKLLNLNFDKDEDIQDPIFDIHVDIDDLIAIIKSLEAYVCGDPRIAARVGSNLIEELFRFLASHKEWTPEFVSVFGRYALLETQCSVLRILSLVRFDTHSDVISNSGAVGVLMNYISIPLMPYAEMAVAALTNIAYCLPKQFKKFVNEALEAVEKIVKRAGDFELKGCVANFMAALCREKELVLCKEKVVLNILQSLLHMPLDIKEPIEQACYALHYLTYRENLEIDGEAFKKLSGRLLYIIGQPPGTMDPSFPGYALRVVGNIARWGTSDQIKILTSKSRLLKSLGTVMLCTSKKIQKEACLIISNIAERGITSIEDMYNADLIEPLCSLLGKDGFDVKLEAAWAIYNGMMSQGSHPDSLDN